MIASAKAKARPARGVRSPVSNVSSNSSGRERYDRGLHTSGRRAKNKCISQNDGEPCFRCAFNSIDCVFEKSQKSDASTSKKRDLETKVEELQRGQRELKDMVSTWGSRPLADEQIGNLLQLVRSEPQALPSHSSRPPMHPPLPGFRPPVGRTPVIQLNDSG